MQNAKAWQATSRGNSMASGPYLFKRHAQPLLPAFTPLVLITGVQVPPHIQHDQGVHQAVQQGASPLLHEEDARICFTCSQ